MKPAVCLSLVLSFACAVAAQSAADTVSASSLPVREVTVFKDGHAYVLRETTLPGAGKRQVVLDELPAPLLGTFWPYATGGAKVVAAKAARTKVRRDRDATDFKNLVVANLGKDAVLVDGAGARIEGKLLDVPKLENGGDGDMLLLQTATGVRALPFGVVRDLEIRGEVRRNRSVEVEQDRLTVEVDGGGNDARVGVAYVQQGLRWIPAYRIDVDGGGKAACKLEATLQNDLVDLAGATVHLVIGVPTFLFEGQVDPISLQQEAALVAAHMPRNAQFSNMLSNSIRTQSAGFSMQAEAAPGQGPSVEGGEQNEDLFVFTVRNVTLGKGERMVLPIAEFALDYKDVYTLRVPFAPPMEVRQGLQSDRALELARELAAPKAKHVLRFTNGDEAPLTTAPALVLRQGRVLAQGRMRYTPRGASTDLEINTAVDIRVETEDHETGRTPNAQAWDGNQYGRVGLAGTISLKNGKRQAVQIEVVRQVLGLVGEAGQGGSAKQADFATLWQDEARPYWWGWWSWPYWWFRFNGFGEFRWQVTLEPGASTTLDANWHYFWR
ncbi:MAG: hypothetical protein RL398_651 [Planctomycetota bacterium]